MKRLNQLEEYTQQGDYTELLPSMSYYAWTGRQGLEGPTERLSGWRKESTQGKWGVGDSASDKLSVNKEENSSYFSSDKTVWSGKLLLKQPILLNWAFFI